MILATKLLFDLDLDAMARQYEQAVLACGEPPIDISTTQFQYVQMVYAIGRFRFGHKDWHDKIRQFNFRRDEGDKTLNPWDNKEE